MGTFDLNSFLSGGLLVLLIASFVPKPVLATPLSRPGILRSALMIAYLLLAALVIQRIVTKDFSDISTIVLAALLCLRWYWKGKFAQLQLD